MNASLNASSAAPGTAAHRPVLGAAQIAEYQATGFLTIRAMLEPALLQRLNAAIDRICAEAAGLTEKTAHIDLDAFHTPERPRIRRISSPTELDEVFMETAFDSVLGDIAADLTGGPVKFYHSKVNFKLPEGGAEIGWHQDWAVFPHTTSNIVALSVPLNPSRSGNGCLQTIPGSHRQGPCSHWDQGRYTLNCNAGMTAADMAQVVDNELDPGDIVAHHGLAVHGSRQPVRRGADDLHHPVCGGRCICLYRAGDRQPPPQSYGARRTGAPCAGGAGRDRTAARFQRRLRGNFHAAGTAAPVNSQASRRAACGAMTAMCAALVLMSR